MQDKQGSSSEVWKSKGHSDVSMETLPSSHVVNTLLQVSVSRLILGSGITLLWSGPGFKPSWECGLCPLVRHSTG